MFSINSQLEICLNKMMEKYKLSLSDVDKLLKEYKYRVKYGDPTQEANTLYVYSPEGDSPDFGKVAAFDMDNTLTYGEQHLYPNKPEDIYLLPGRRRVLEDLAKKGYRLVVFTNQKAKTKPTIKKRLARVKTFLEKLNLPVTAFISTGADDEYRKPDIGAWKEYRGKYTNKAVQEGSFFCGDALGRPGDFADSDRMFGENADLLVLSPEEVFPAQEITLTLAPKHLIMLVGAPGTGKSHFAQKYFPDFVYINQDTLKSRLKVLRAVKTAVEQGKNIIVDATNRSLDSRQEIYDLAPTYTIDIFYFVNDGRRFNSQREGNEKVESITYHIYFKYLDPPTVDELGDRGDLHIIEGQNVVVDRVELESKQSRALVLCANDVSAQDKKVLRLIRPFSDEFDLGTYDKPGDYIIAVGEGISESISHDTDSATVVKIKASLTTDNLNEDGELYQRLKEYAPYDVIVDEYCPFFLPNFDRDIYKKLVDAFVPSGYLLSPVRMLENDPRAPPGFSEGPVRVREGSQWSDVYVRLWYRD